MQISSVVVLYDSAALRRADEVVKSRVAQCLVRAGSGKRFDRGHYGTLTLEPTVLARPCFEMGRDCVRVCS